MPRTGDDNVAVYGFQHCGYLTDFAGWNHDYLAGEYIDHLPDGRVYIPEEESDTLGGYYYYTKIVEPGKKTVPLFERRKTHFDTAEQIY